ncbi:hypothetical protein [Thermomonospora umbrina]|uniref:WD40 repeat protein n=1 Tax=Thermomonospora umbrina TaxID=111806 RepID=A0A3D9SSQ8_9ACTN|nr:hypothetical protein [Thermomonospora umbrina]REE99009.1 WD40 repeat protein [Thermomonospora umbrina]
MGRPERPVDPSAGPVERLAWELRRLRDEAGRPSYRELARRAHYSRSTLAEVATGVRLPTLEATLAYAVACGGDRDEWERRWEDAAAELKQAHRRCPYPGLAPLGPEDADLFFGRAELVEELRRSVAASPLTAVFGASGSGKTSLLLAGLVPALTADGLDTAVLTPGPRPLSRLTEVPSEPADGVLIVDQFEEVFTLCRDDDERTAFLDGLTAMVGDEDGRTVVIGVRADFYAHCARHAGLVAALREHGHLPIGPMSEDELREIIVEPAARVGLTVEPGLLTAAVAETVGRPGALPLVAHALRETWAGLDGDELRLADYRAAGGVREAVARSAERLYRELDDPQRAVVRGLFLRLTALGEGTDDTRRRVDRDELTGLGEPGEIDALLDRLAAARLVIVDDGTVDVCHEALIGAWPRLRDWLTTDREELVLHRSLTGAAAEWERNGRHEEFLHRGARLAVWEGRDTVALNELERDFLAAGRRHEAAARTAARRRVRLGFGGLGLVAAVVAVLAVVAMLQAGRAADERDRAVSRRLASDARTQLERDPELALLLAAEAYAMAPTNEADTVLRQAVVDFRLRRTLSTGQRDIRGAVFSPAGGTAATWTGSSLRTWRWNGRDWSLSAPKRERRSRARSVPKSIALRPDGRVLAAGLFDGTIDLWTLDDDGDPEVLRGPKNEAVTSLAFSGDGRRLATVHDDRVHLWDLKSGRRSLVLPRAERRLETVALSHDGEHLVTGGFRTQLWDVSGRRPRLLLTGRQSTVTQLAFSPDGAWAVAATAQSTVESYAVPGFPLGDREPSVEHRGHQGTVGGLAFSPDGRRLASYGEDRTIRVWDTGSGASPLVLRVATGTLRGVAFSRDGRWLTSVSEDGAVRFWDVSSGHAGGTVDLPGRGSGEGRRVLSADGGAFATDEVVSPDLRVWDVRRGGPPTVLRDGRVNGPFAASPDGRRFARADTFSMTKGDDTLPLWDLGAGDRPRMLRSKGEKANALVFSHDGRYLAGAGDNTVQVWDAEGGDAPTAVLRGYDLVGNSMEFGPDGRRLAVALFKGDVVLRDVTGKDKPTVLRGPTGVTDLEFAPDGRRIAASNADGTVHLWRTDRPGVADTVLRSREGALADLAFTRDGVWLASTARTDGVLRLWRVDGGGEPVLISGFGSVITHVAFAPDGRGVTTAHADRPVRAWTCEICGPGPQVLRLARERATRDLTPEERRTFLGTP